MGLSERSERINSIFIDDFNKPFCEAKWMILDNSFLRSKNGNTPLFEN